MVFELNKKYKCSGINESGYFEVIVRCIDIDDGYVYFEEVEVIDGYETISRTWRDYNHKPIYKYEELV